MRPVRDARAPTPFCVLALCLAGCISFSKNADGPAFAEDAIVVRPGLATVVVYRPDVYAGSALWPTLSVDGKAVLHLYNRGYSVLHLAPGERRISTRIEKPGFVQRIVQEEQELLLRVGSGETYFIEYAVSESPKNKTMIVSGAEIAYSDQPVSRIRLLVREKFPTILRWCRYVAPLGNAVPSG
jgi:hypothetical protein